MSFLSRNLRSSELRSSTRADNGDRNLRRNCLKSGLDAFVNLCTEWWLLEILSWVLGAICMSCIAGVLAFFDHKPLPSAFPLGITINTYVSVLSAIAKLALAVPLEEALGAQKYLWFSTNLPERPLMDFERFDSAPRGPLGAIRLLLRTRTRSAGTIGGFVVLLSLALDPFFQQLVAMPKRSSLDNRSKIPRVVKFQKPDLMEMNGTAAIGDNGMMNNAVSTFYTRWVSLEPVNFFCSSNDCTWPVFDTLGVCSQCEDISDMIEFGCRKEPGDWRTEYGEVDYLDLLPRLNQTSCGWFFNISSDTPMLMSGYSVNVPTDADLVDQALIMRLLNLRDPFTNELYWNTTLKFPQLPAPMTNFAIVAASDTEAVFQNKTPQAYECAMRWCTKTVSSTFSQGVLNERVISVFTNDTQIPDPLVVTWVNGNWNYDYNDGISITPPGQPDTFFVDNVTALSQRFTMDNWAPSFLTQTNLSTQPFLRYENDFPRGQGLGFTSESTNATSWIATSRIPDVMNEMADAMTNALRNNGLYSEDVLGSGVPETFIEIQWAWFSFPLIVLGITLVFLLITIWQTSGQSTVFKGSSLIALTHGLSWDAKYVFRDARSMREIKAKAKEVPVHFNMDKEAGILDVKLEQERQGTWSEKFITAYSNS